MVGIKGNRRVVYTKKAIKDSMLKLLEEKEIHHYKRYIVDLKEAQFSMCRNGLHLPKNG